MEQSRQLHQTIWQTCSIIAVLKEMCSFQKKQTCLIVKLISAVNQCQTQLKMSFSLFQQIITTFKVKECFMLEKTKHKFSDRKQQQQATRKNRAARYNFSFETPTKLLTNVTGGEVSTDQYCTKTAHLDIWKLQVRNLI